MIKIDGKDIYEIEDIVKIINDAPLSGNSIAPPVVIGEEHSVKNIFLDSQGNQHLDLGYISKYSWVTSWETNEILPNSNFNGVHWIHPSRVKLVKQ